MRVLRFKQLRDRVGLSRSQIERLEAVGRFPKRLRLGPGAVGWLESEVDAYIAERVRERDGEAA